MHVSPYGRPPETCGIAHFEWLSMRPRISVEAITQITAGMALKMFEMGNHPVSTGPMGQNLPMADGWCVTAADRSRLLSAFAALVGPPRPAFRSAIRQLI